MAREWLSSLSLLNIVSLICTARRNIGTLLASLSLPNTTSFICATGLMPGRGSFRHPAMPTRSIVNITGGHPHSIGRRRTPSLGAYLCGTFHGAPSCLSSRHWSRYRPSEIERSNYEIPRTSSTLPRSIARDAGRSRTHHQNVPKPVLAPKVFSSEALHIRMRPMNRRIVTLVGRQA